MGGSGNDMEALSPRDANARQAKQPQELKKAVANLKNARAKGEKEAHPPPPPAFVTEPPCRDRRQGAVYEIRNCLGKGGFAICYEGKLNGTSKRYALKIVKCAMPQKMEQKFQTELQIHSKMRQQNIVQFHRAFTFEASTYLVLELCPNGSLMDMVKRRKGLSEPEVRFYTVQIAGAIKYMHSKGIIHRDLKMGNIFLDRHMNAKVGDFGLAALLVTGKDMHTIRRTTLCGTPNYIAPEILEKGRKGHDHMVDIWSLGIIVFAMLTSRPPFQSSTTDEIYRRAKDRDYDWPDAPGKYISAEAKELVADMLQDADARPEPDQIVQHDWFLCGYMPVQTDMTTKLRDMPPDSSAFYERNTTAQIEKNRRALHEMCRQCGVGPWNQVQLVTRQIWRECAEEEQQGLTPVIPLSKGIVYRPFDEVKTELKLQQDLKLHSRPQNQQPSSYQSSASSRSSTEEDEVIDLDEAYSRPSKASTTSSTAAPALSGLRAAPPQSFAAQQRQQNKPPTGTFRSQQPLSPPPKEPQPPRPMESLRTGLRGPRGVTRAMAQMTANDLKHDEAGSSSSNQPPGHARTRSTSSTSTSSSQATIRASDQNREQDNQSEKNRGKQPANENDYRDQPATRSEKSHGKQAATESSSREEQRPGRPERPERPQRPQRPARPDEQIPGRPARPDEQQAASYRPANREIITPIVEKRDRAPPRGITQDQKELLQMRMNLERPRDLPSIFSPNEQQEKVQGSQPDVLLASLKKFQAELERSLNSRSMAIISPRDKTPPPPRIVVKWVDYTNKFGIGYILDDGSVGCCLNQFDQPESIHDTVLKLPPCCMVVHGAERHMLRKDDESYPDRHQIAPMDQTIYIYENNGEAGFTRVRCSPQQFRIEILPDGTPARMATGKDIYDHRKRERIVLWKKFANYMVAFGRGMDERQPIDRLAHTRVDARHAHEDMVTFYQRMGDVGCWMFADGHMQFNFPDHTKVVLDSTGTWCHFWHLSIAAAKKLSETGVLEESALDDRTVLTYPLQTLLNFHLPPRQPLVPARRRPEIPLEMREIPSANQFRKKIEFVRDVVREWTKNNGIGNITFERSHRIRWTGMRETVLSSGGQQKPGQPLKMIWVTVGARGGDRRVSCYVDPKTPDVLGEDIDESARKSDQRG